MAKLELVRIDKDGKETVLEVTPVPDGFTLASVLHPSGNEYIKKLEEHYKKTGKPKKSYIDVLYICRPQVERWTIQELEGNIDLEAAKLELEKRRQTSKGEIVLG